MWYTLHLVSVYFDLTWIQAVLTLEFLRQFSTVIHREYTLSVIIDLTVLMFSPACREPPQGEGVAIFATDEILKEVL